MLFCSYVIEHPIVGTGDKEEGQRECGELKREKCELLKEVEMLKEKAALFDDDVRFFRFCLFWCCSLLELFAGVLLA